MAVYTLYWGQKERVFRLFYIDLAMLWLSNEHSGRGEQQFRCHFGANARPMPNR